MPEDIPVPPPKVDALAALGPLVELVAKGGAGALAVIVLAWQVYTGTTSIQARIETLDTSMRTEIGGLATRITTLEQRVAIADAIRERDEREAQHDASPVPVPTRR
jgi:hypothetical protein